MEKVDLRKQSVIDNCHRYKGTIIEQLDRKVRKDSSTQIKGIRKNKSGSYTATICLQGRRIIIGTYDEREDAIASRKEYERIMYSKLKKQYEKENNIMRINKYNFGWEKVDLKAKRGLANSEEQYFYMTSHQLHLMNLPEGYRNFKFVVYMSKDKKDLMFHLYEKDSQEDFEEGNGREFIQITKGTSKKRFSTNAKNLKKILNDNGWVDNKKYEFIIEENNVIISCRKEGE